MSANTSCPTNFIPTNLAVPNNVTYAVIPGSNTSDPWMVNCCAPNPVHLANDCWEWCEITDGMASFNVSSPYDHTNQVAAAISTCLVINERPLNESNGLEIRAKSFATGGRQMLAKSSALMVTWVVLLGLTATFS